MIMKQFLKNAFFHLINKEDMPPETLIALENPSAAERQSIDSFNCDAV